MSPVTRNDAAATWGTETVFSLAVYIRVPDQAKTDLRTVMSARFESQAGPTASLAQVNVMRPKWPLANGCQATRR